MCRNTFLIYTRTKSQHNVPKWPFISKYYAITPNHLNDIAFSKFLWRML